MSARRRVAQQGNRRPGDPRRDALPDGVTDVPYRLLAAKELAELLKALAHPRRIQLLEELRAGEIDVASLAAATGLAPSSVSQHLMVLRAHRLVAERREGRRVLYRIRSRKLADWLTRGMDFLQPMDQQAHDLRRAIKKAQSKWSG